MKLDKDTLISEVEGHEVRMQGPLWSKDSGEPDADWTASLRNDSPASSESASHAPTYESPSRPPPMPRAPSPDLSTTEILPRLDALDHAVERLSTANYLSKFSDEKLHDQKSRKRLGNGGV